MLGAVIHALGSVLTSENGEKPIQFFHMSFRDFLVSLQRPRRYTVNSLIAHPPSTHCSALLQDHGQIAEAEHV